MYAEFATSRLIDFLRASGSYDLEMVCSQNPSSLALPSITQLLVYSDRHIKSAKNAISC